MVFLSDTASNTFQAVLRFEDIALDKQEIARTSGYTDGILPDHFDRMIDGVLSRTPHLCRLLAGYRLIPIDQARGGRETLVIGGIPFTTRPIVTARLKKADQAILFLCSIGPGMEQWSGQLAGESEPALSYFVDTVASLVVEATADALHAHLTRHFKEQGLNITNRYSPGYCDWPVAEQKTLFSFLPDAFCGVTLTDSAMMLPLKSISGLIGVGKHVEYKQYSCATCSRQDCTYKVFREKRSKTYIKGNEL
jgi:hypothetical protein